MGLFEADGFGPEVPKAFVEALKRTFQDGPSAEFVDYVLIGEPSGVLSGPAGPHLRKHRADPDLFTCLDGLPTDVALRFARAYAHAHPLRYWRSPSLVGAAWAEVLVARMEEMAPQCSISTLERMSEAAGLPAELTLTAAFTDDPSVNGAARYDRAIRRMKGYAEAAERHADAIRATIGQATMSGRLASIAMLAAMPDDVLALFADVVAGFAVHRDGQLQRATAALGDRLGSRLVEPLQAVAATGDPRTRLDAYQRIHALGNEEVRRWAAEFAAQDRAPRVRALVDQWIMAGDPEEPMPVARPVIEWRVSVTPRMRAALDVVQERASERVEEHNLRYQTLVERYSARGETVPPWEATKQLPIRPTWAEGVAAALAAGRPPNPKDGSRRDSPGVREICEYATELDGLGVTGLMIVLAHCDHLLDERGYGRELDWLAVEAFNEFQEANGRPSLLEIATALDELGRPGGKYVLSSYADAWGDRLGREWPDDQVAPFVSVYLDQVLALHDNKHYRVNRFAAYDALATLSVLPRRVVDELFARALGSRKADRLPAQDLLATKLPGYEERIISALADGKAEVRATAAAWLQRLGHADAVPALETAIRKEKQDLAAGAILDALESFGQPVEKYLDRASLRTQADKLLAKGLPKEMSWFSVDSMPDVRWADTGETIPRAVLTWFLAQAVKAKSPEPGAVLRKYAGIFEPRDRERFGQFVLESWIVEDLTPFAPDEAPAEADRRAQEWWHWHRQTYASPAELAAAWLPGILREPRASAIGSKGLLAVAGACAGEPAAAVAERYLREWYGIRAAQGRALIGMLAWVDHPSATQLMLSIGTRFRTKSFQQEATRQAEALAERKGWTVAELADRTIPTAGFDETGTLELSYGGRSFTARLTPDLTVVLHDPEGKPIKTLPAPRKSDDEERAKASKKMFQAARKELKAVATLQTARLYEALCTERSWPADDWSRYLNRHPVLRHATQRLAWLAIDVSGARQVFRPLADGTLTDVDDNEVTVPADARVGVAHDSNLEPEEVAAWVEHFVDYEVSPLFQQFGKGRFELSEEQGKEKAIEKFRGHLVEAFKLRSRATKLGYTRGETQDGGWFVSYDKRFPTLGLHAAVEFTGNPLPEENRTVALLGVSFVKVGEHGRTPLRLADVPAVLVSECYHDLRLMAAEGPGFDPDWEKKSEYR